MLPQFEAILILSQRTEIEVVRGDRIRFPNRYSDDREREIDGLNSA